MDYSIEIILKQIGQKIKEMRLEKKLTQSILATYADIDIRTVQLIEKGELNMSLKVLYSISAALDIHPSELLQKIKEKS